MDVVRTWAFMDGDDGSFDGRSMQPRRGTFPEENFLALDELLAELRAREMRAILTLTNQWEDYGGIDRYARWAREEGETSTGRREDFFASAKCREFFEAFVRAVVTRRNAITGELYEDDPTIFSYQLINEPRIAGDASGDVFDAWATHFGTFIKRLDHEKHLVSVGTEGFFMHDGANEINPFGGADRQGVDIDRLHRNDAIDFICVHVWADNWMDSDEESKLRFLDRWVREHIARSKSSSKPVIFEEFGKKRPLAVRDAFFTRVFELLREDDERSSGALLWLFSAEDVEDYDGFTVYAPSDESTLAIVRDEVESMRAFTASGATNVSVPSSWTPPPAPPPPPKSDDDDDDDDIVVDFPPDDPRWNVRDVLDATGGVVLSYTCRMSSSNAFEAHATYGDHVSIELAFEATRELDVFIEFVTSTRERMILTSERVTSNRDGGERVAASLAATRRLGDDDVYVNEGPITFQIYLIERGNMNAYVVDAVTSGTTVVFDSAAPFVVDAFLRPYKPNSNGGSLTFDIDFGDVAVLYVLFSEPVEEPEFRANGRRAFVSPASSHGDAYYAYIEITSGVDSAGDEIAFEIVSALDRAGNPCFTCENVVTQTTDGSALRVARGSK